MTDETTVVAEETCADCATPEVVATEETSAPEETPAEAAPEVTA